MRKLFLGVSLFISLLISFTTYADLGEAWRLLRESRGSTRNYPQIIKLLVDNRLYFASIPYIKEYLTTTSGNQSPALDGLIDQVVSHVGVKQFEVLPVRFLSRSQAPTLQYVLARKYFRQGQFSQALIPLRNSIPRSHPSKPFALFLEASIYSLTNKHEDAINTYRECVSLSKNMESKNADLNRKRQLTINGDYCVAGIARVQFAAGNNEQANSSYLDIQKTSFIWPEILFEEAWNSFYLRDYNRTLGKLVTYKAPVLDFIYNPEIDVLKALTYMELCLWEDTGKVVDEFYAENERDYEQLRRFLANKNQDYQFYYMLAKSRRDGVLRENKLLNRLLHTVVRDPAYQEIYDSFLKGRDELEVVNKINIPNFKRILTLNLKESLLLQRDLVGAYTKSQLELFSKQIGQSFVDMSYIKLEVLDRRKASLYSPEQNMNRGRGDVANLKRTDKQYFWNFNGEFWADELGDYVFSLKSECEG